MKDERIKTKVKEIEEKLDSITVYHPLYDFLTNQLKQLKNGGRYSK